MKQWKNSWRSVVQFLLYPLISAGVFEIGQTIVVIAVLYLAVFFSQSSAETIKNIIAQPVPLMLVTLLAYSVIIFLLVFGERKIKHVIEKRKKVGKKYFLEVFGLTGLPTWTDIGLGVAGFVVQFILALIVVQVFTVFPFFDASEAQDVGFNALVNGRDRVAAFLAIVVLAPLVEELVFRGWLYGHLRKIPLKSERLSVFLSIVMTSLCFAVLHGQWNVAVNVFCMSAVCCLLREFTGTTYAGILVHMLKNWFAFLLIYILGIS